VYRPLFLAASLFLALPFSGLAQRYHAHTYTQSDGLPSSVVFDIVQDAAGRMWFATRGGIAVFDGIEWRSYRQADGLPQAGQGQLAFDPSGTLWAAPQGGSWALFAFDGQRWNPLPLPPDSRYFREPFRRLAVAGQGDGLQVTVGTETGGLLLWDGRRWHRFAERQGLAERILALAAYQGHILAGTHEGLFSLRGLELTPVPLASPSAAVHGIAVEERAGEEDRLWVAGAGWVGVLQGETFTLVGQDIDLPPMHDPKGLVLQPDGEGGVFVGGALGLIRLDREGEVEILGRGSGLVALDVTALCLDREGHLWVGSTRGVTKFVSFRFANYGTPHGLLEDEVSAVLERASGQIVLGHNLGLTILGPSKPVRWPLSDGVRFPGARVLDLAEDSQGALWIAYGDHGFVRLSPTGEVRHFGATEGFSYGGSVLVDGDDQLWAASTTTLYRYEDEHLVAVHTPPNPKIRRLFEGRDGTLYLATAGLGLLVSPRPDERVPRSWSTVANLELENVYAFLEDRQGRRWVGTKAGLFRLGSRGAERVQVAGGARGHPIYFLLQDPQDRLWLGTDDGVLCWDGVRVNRFTVEDGLSGRETNRAAGIVDSRGHVWIGTDQGVSVYFPDKDHVSLPPKVELRAVMAGGRSHSLAEPLRLDHDENDLVFQFRAISFRDETRVQLRSRLEGFEEDWSADFASPRQEIRYTNLPPGRYRFHLRAASAEGAWSDVVSSAVLMIDSPIYQRPWFYLSLGLLVVLLLSIGQRGVAQWRYSRRLGEEVAHRTTELAAANRELATLSQEKADFLAIAAHDLRVPLVNLRGFAAEVGMSLKDLGETLEPLIEKLPEAKRRHARALLQGDLPEELAFIDSSAARMDRLVTAILQLSRLERRELMFVMIDTEALVAILLESLAYRLEQHPATVEKGELPSVVADPMAMELVFQNLLSNAVAYLDPERPGRIAIRGRRIADEVIFEVADNGRGIAEAEQAKVFQVFGRAGPGDTEGEGMGLAYVRTLLRRHGGRVWFESRLGEGTVFYFALPVREPGSSGWSDQAVKAGATADGSPRPQRGEVTVSFSSSVPSPRCPSSRR